MPNVRFDPDNTLAGGLFAMTPKEAVLLGIRLCSAVERAVGADGCHCGVWPGNVTWVDGDAAVGAENRQSIAEMTPEMLEFTSPEMFWSGESSPASDVYSIGLILYTALNRGIMPYFKKAEDNSPEERAAALENRMKGVKLEYPATAGRALGDVVLKAAAFNAGERYATPGMLRAALEALPEGSRIPAQTPVVPLSRGDKEKAPAYKVDKDFDQETQPLVKRNGKGRGNNRSAARSRLLNQIIEPEDAGKTEQVMRSLVKGHTEESTEPKTPQPETSKPEPEVEEPTRVISVAPQSPPPQPEPVPAPPPPPAKKPNRRAGEVDENMDVSTFRGQAEKKRSRLIFPLILAAVVVVALIFLLRSCKDGKPLPPNDAPVDTPTAVVTAPPETAAPVTEPPAVTEAPVETAPPALHGRDLVPSDTSWTAAAALAQEAGGVLGAVRSAGELQETIELAERAGVRYVWLGASRGQDGNWYYLDGTPMDFDNWETGEPAGMATGRNYLLLRYRPMLGTWGFAASADDPAAALPETYSGVIGYLVDYDAVAANGETVE